MHTHSEAEPGAVALPPPAPTLAATAPHIAQVNVSRNSRMHIGPQFVTLTQNVHRDRVVKEVSVWRMAWVWTRATSRGERLACVAVLATLALCAAAAGLLAAGAAQRDSELRPDVAPHEWNITRQMWLALPHSGAEEPWPGWCRPLRLVIVQHTVGPECHRFDDCAALMRNLQNYYFRVYHYDLPYHFVVGNDARVYEGRGASLVGAHTLGYNRCALGLAFTGNYRYGSGGSVPTASQQQRARSLLAAGVRAGWLHARHVLLGARDVRDTVSPGDALYAALRTWPAAPADSHHFTARTCDNIYAELAALDGTPTSTPSPY